MNNKSNWIDVLSLIISLFTLVVVAYAALGPLAQLQKDIALQNYRDNIEIQFNYPDLKKVNSWKDDNIHSFLEKPLFHNEKGQPIYQSQFSVLNAPNDFLVEVFIFKRIVSEKNPNIFQQYSTPIELRLPDNRIPFANNKNKPRIFKLDMLIVDQNPTTIIINVLDMDRTIIKSEFFHIES
jgi:hypothetical protein